MQKLELPKLDRYDIDILAALQANGCMTYEEIGDLVGLSPSPCVKPVKRLESTGYLAGYGAWIELHKLHDELTTVFWPAAFSNWPISSSV